MSHTALLTASFIPPGDLQVVQIYFDTSSFDEIERDVKVTIEFIENGCALKSYAGEGLLLQ